MNDDTTPIPGRRDDETIVESPAPAADEPVWEAAPEPAATPPAATEAAPVPEGTAPRRRWRDRARDVSLGWRGALAVALAGVVLGGVGGAVGTAAFGDGHHPGDRFGSDRFPGLPGREGRPAGPPPGVPGQPPATAPDQDTQPDGFGDSSSGSNS